jgi:hypothetical protein
MRAYSRAGSRIERPQDAEFRAPRWHVYSGTDTSEERPVLLHKHLPRMGWKLQSQGRELLSLTA